MRKNSRRNMAAGTVEKIADTIGNNMKDIRCNSRSSKFTVKYVVSEINRVLPEELQITTGLYYKWESEERMPTARHIPAIAYALGVSEAALFHWQTFKRDVGMGNQERLIESICALSDDKIKELAWLVSGWDGDVKALVEFDMLYVSMPVEDRRDVASLGIRLYDVCKKEDRLRRDVPMADFPYLQQVLRDMWADDKDKYSCLLYTSPSPRDS